jgi:adenosine deaminase
VAISTDDEGVARSDMTHEYLRAVAGYRLSYIDLKRMTRQSLEHSFLPGQSLWAETKSTFRPVAACASDFAGKPSHACSEFLADNERAREQWKVETEYTKFEKKY